MFDEVIKELKRTGLEKGVRVPVKVPLDEDGFFDRKCQSPECGAEFKLHFDDWCDKVREEVVHCPICRHQAPAKEWSTPKQKRYFKQVALRHAHKVINEALRRGAERSRPWPSKDSFIQFHLSHRPGTPPIVIPISAAAVMQHKSICESCGCRYASIGAAFFCPACGHNSAATTFDGAVQTIRNTIATIPCIRGTITTASGADAAQDTVRHIIEDSLNRLVASFQRFAQAMFESLLNASQFNLRKNVFQSLSEGSDLWRKACAKGYDDMLSAAEMADMNRLFQQRHLISHRDGIVDQEYISRSGDTTYAVGQRLVVQEASVLRLADVCSKLARGLRDFVSQPKSGGIVP